METSPLSSPPSQNPQFQVGYRQNPLRPLAPFCLLILLIASVGCVQPILQGGKGSVGPGPLTAPQIVAKLKERSAFWRDYQCKFRLRVDSRTSRFTTRAVVSVKGRNFVRFETFTPLGQTAALYVSNEKGPSLLIPSEKAIFTAQRPETLIQQFLGVSLSADLFRYVLSASIPQERLDQIESRFDAGIWRFSSVGGEGSFEWRVTARPLALEALSAQSAGFEGRVVYEPPVALATEAVPGLIRISSNEWNMEISLDELKLAPQFQPSAFYMPELPDLRKVDLDKIR